MRAPRSLAARLLAAATAVLAAFLVLTGLALDRAFRDGVREAQRARLEAQVYALLAALEVERGRVVMPPALPEARYATAGSGLYAEIAAPDGRVLWRSASAVGLDIPWPPGPDPGEAAFATVRASDGQALFAYAFGVEWEAGKRVVPLVVRVAEETAAYEAQVAGFRRSLVLWLGAATFVLLVVEALLLRWGLAPLRRLAREVAAVEAGERGAIAGSYPAEVQPLVDALNALIRSGRALIERYRNALGDLAHSLKTPLAVLRGAAEGREGPEALRATVADQAGRMQRLVDYHLQRAAAAGRSPAARAVAVAPVVGRVLATLAKVHAARGVRLENAVDEGVRFLGDEGDLMEVVGNLADNACKHGGGRVRVSAETDAQGRLLALTVEDDGPGIPEAARAALLERGVRGDTRTEGQGIGLAVVREIAAAYGGGVAIGRSAALGGARVTVRFGPA